MTDATTGSWMDRRSPSRRGVRLLALLAAILLPPASLPAAGVEDPFAALTVQRPANPAPAPALRLPSLDGRPVDLRDLRGKVVLLGFFTTT